VINACTNRKGCTRKRTSIHNTSKWQKSAKLYFLIKPRLEVNIATSDKNDDEKLSLSETHNFFYLCIFLLRIGRIDRVEIGMTNKGVSLRFAW